MILRIIFVVLLMLLPNSLKAETGTETTAYDFTFTSIEGSHLPLSSFRGKTILLVNTASFCGFTYQYGGLQKVWESYRDKGLVVLGVPSNDFGDQEPGNESEIKEFCEVNFDVDFPLTAKVHVKGNNAHPFYRWAARTLGNRAAPRWNFHKYLIDADGHLVDWFGTRIAPDSQRVLAAIEANLPERHAGITRTSD